ncbi:MAG: cytochrome P450 [Patulibacter sp.]
MTTTSTQTTRRSTGRRETPWVASEAGPIDEAAAAGLATAPMVGVPPLLQALRMNVRQSSFMRAMHREYGDVFRVDFHNQLVPEAIVVSHPDHIKSLFTADPTLAPSRTGSSPLRPIVGESSVLTATGARHMRQRKLLLPAFHGQAIAHYQEQIQASADREIATWTAGKTFPLGPSAQAITLDVIMAGVFGVDGRPAKGTLEHRVRQSFRRALALSMTRIAKVAEFANRQSHEAVGVQRLVVESIDGALYPLITKRRAEHVPGARHDVLSMLLDATTEDGVPLSDEELRNELMTLVLAGHETTANTIAWTFERLTRNPEAYARLRDEVRAGDGSEYLDAVIHESMRSRPVIPMLAREVTVPWRFGDFAVPAGSVVAMSVLLLHHREDIYPEPLAFRPERFLGVKPGTYSWIPFGGGIRRCLGAALAMAEMRTVIAEIVRRTDLVATDPAPESARHRNVTMVPARGGRVKIARMLG